MKRVSIARLVFCALLAIAALPTQAALITATYQITASDFHDSNGSPPQSPTSNSVSGVYTFTFDNTASIQNEIAPDSVTGLDIVNNAGTLLDYNTSNSGVDTVLNTYTNSGRITVGGNASSVAYMVGLSNDFRVIFDIDLTDYQVSSVFENFSFVSVADPFYQANNTSVTLLGVSAVPEPSTYALMGVGLLGLTVLRRCSHRACRREC